MRLMLKECRKKSGKTQSQLAKELGISTVTYGSWERGDRMISAAQLWEVCVALGCDPNTILGWYEDHPEALPRPAPARAAPSTPDEGELLGLFRTCTPDRQRRTLDDLRDRAAVSGEAEPDAPLAAPGEVTREAV